MSGRPKKPGPPSNKAKALSEKVRDAREILRNLQERGDGDSGDYSMAHCSAMAKFWGAKFLQADLEYSGAKDPDSRKRAHNDMLAASKEAGEWEKRKAGAASIEKLDKLKRVLAKLEEQEQLANELLEIEE